MSDIDISGLNKAAVLAALYNAARPQGLGFLQSNDAAMTVDEAQAILDSGQTDFDYLHGRVMKVDLSGDSFDQWGYDRDNGEAAASIVIRALRETNDTNNSTINRVHYLGTSAAAAEVQTRTNSFAGPEAIEKAKEAALPYVR